MLETWLRENRVQLTVLVMLGTRGGFVASEVFGSAQVICIELSYCLFRHYNSLVVYRTNTPACHA